MCQCTSHSEYPSELDRAWLVVLWGFIAMPCTVLGLLFLVTGLVVPKEVFVYLGSGMMVLGVFLIWLFAKLCRYPFYKRHHR